MHRLAFVVLSVAMLAACSAEPLAAMGSDHPADQPLGRIDAWPEGFHAAVDQPFRVHGYWVNSYDRFFYRGEQKQFLQMLTRLREINGVSVDVQFEPGKGIAKSPWSKNSVGEADWAVSIDDRFVKDGGRKEDRTAKIVVIVWKDSASWSAKMDLTNEPTEQEKPKEVPNPHSKSSEGRTRGQRKRAGEVSSKDAAVTIAIRLIDEDGNALSGVKIRLYDGRNVWRGREPKYPMQFATTGEDGNASFEDVLSKIPDGAGYWIEFFRPKDSELRFPERLVGSGSSLARSFTDDPLISRRVSGSTVTFTRNVPPNSELSMT